MKKLFIALTAALALSLSATAQTAEEIYKNYLDKTGIEKFISSRDGRSSMTEVEMIVGPATIASKITSKYPSMHRVELDIQGQTALVIIRDTVAYLNAMGKIQTFTGEEVRQVAPVVDLVKDIVQPTDLDKCTIKFIGKEGKGKTALNVIEVTEKANPENSKTALYFNAETGLVDRSVTEVKDQDNKPFKIEVTYKKYTSFDDGALLLPTSIVTKMPNQTITINVQNFELDFPVANWMFAAPKQ